MAFRLKKLCTASWIKRILIWLLAFLLFSTLFLIGLIQILRTGPIETSSFILQEQISGIFSSDSVSVRQDWVYWDQISSNMALAVVAAEDQRFPHHSGIDIKAVKRAISSSGDKTRGASTITQQVAKNLFFWGGRSYLRKGLEAVTALIIELLWSKERILEVYLNIAQFGKGVYGVKAASKTYYAKSPSSLSASESALMAAVLPNPVIYSVARPSAYTRKRQQWILRQMRQLGGISYLRQLDH